MINDFLIINCIGKDDKLALRINKDFFIKSLKNKNNYDQLVVEIFNFLYVGKKKKTIIGVIIKIEILNIK